MDISRNLSKDSVEGATKRAILSGLLTGGGLAGFGSLWAGMKPASIAKATLGGALTMGGLAGGSTYLGNKLMGTPNTEDTSGYTRHGAVGGGLGGAGMGALLGALATRGKLPLLPENAIMRGLAKMTPKRGAILGALGLGAAGAYEGADEGMQLDFLRNEMKEQKRKQMLKETYGL